VECGFVHREAAWIAYGLVNSFCVHERYGLESETENVIEIETETETEDWPQWNGCQV
jgi:hypothetical protein